MSVSLDELKKAVSKLEEALQQHKNEFIRDSVIQVLLGRWWNFIKNINFSSI